MMAMICSDCGIDTREIDEYYMVHFELWEQVIPERNGFLCIGCLEERLGRELNAEDFLDCPLNKEMIIYAHKPEMRLHLSSERLFDRLTRKKEG